MAISERVRAREGREGVEFTSKGPPFAIIDDHSVVVDAAGSLFLTKLRSPALFRRMCAQGRSIEISEPSFGLRVTGSSVEKMWNKNSGKCRQPSGALCLFERSGMVSPSRSSSIVRPHFTQRRESVHFRWMQIDLHLLLSIQLHTCARISFGLDLSWESHDSVCSKRTRLEMPFQVGQQ